MSEWDPYAEITQIGRWTWKVVVREGMAVHGLGGGDGWHVLGRKRAERKGHRVLARYVRDQHRNDNPIRIDLPPSATEGADDRG